MRASILCILLLACGTSTTGMSGPTMSGKLEDNSDDAPAIQSNDILARDAQAKTVTVKHILISWRDLAKNYDNKIDPRGQGRSHEEADALAKEVLEKVRAGEDMEPLMAKYSEDAGSSQSGRSYDVNAEAKLVFEFKRLSMRLKVGEAGLVQTLYGWHIIKRVE